MSKIKSIKELDTIFNSITEDKKSEATLIYNELVFIIDTIDKLKEDIKNKGATEHFIQGKQNFLRENPALTSYTKLMKTYDVFYKNLINLINKDTSDADNSILSKSDFSFEIFTNDSYDVYDSILNNEKYKKASDKDKDKIYNRLLDAEYQEYKKDPSNYLFTHDSLKD